MSRSAPAHPPIQKGCRLADPQTAGEHDGKAGSVDRVRYAAKQPVDLGVGERAGGGFVIAPLPARWLGAQPLFVELSIQRSRRDCRGIKTAAMRQKSSNSQETTFFEHTSGGIFDHPILPPTFSHLISPARRNILAPAGKIILE
jgi:hypothetical protein